MNKIHLFLAFVLLVVVALLVRSNYEAFTNYLTSSKYVLSNGSITKKLNNNIYHYYFRFNLPLHSGNEFNNSIGRYKVFLGKTQPESQLKGELERYGDGSYIFEYKSTQNYLYASIIFEQNDKFSVIFRQEL